MARCLTSLILIISFLCSICRAAATSSLPAASTFLEADGNGQNLTISVNVPATNDADDLFFHMTAPSAQGWIAFGFGSQMKDALIFVAYPGADGKNVTLSPRLGKGHVQPQLYSNTTVEVLEGSGVFSDLYVVNAKCQHCRTWDGGSIDLTSTSQPMIYAVGDGSDVIKNNSQSATIQQHYANGHFTLDMKAATGIAGVPVLNLTSNNANNTQIEHDISDSGGLSRAVHAILMAGSFVVGYPLGLLLLRVFERLWMHWLIQTFTTCCVVCGAASGIYISVKYDKHPSLNSGHQIIGLIIFIGVLIQLTIGFVHHRIFKKTNSSTPFRMVHRILGPAVMVIGIINGGIGFHFADRRGYAITYSLIVVIILLAVGTILFFRKKSQRKKEAMTSAAAQNCQQPDIPLNSYGQYPQYAAPQYGQPQYGGQWQTQQH